MAHQTDGSLPVESLGGILRAIYTLQTSDEPIPDSIIQQFNNPTQLSKDVFDLLPRKSSSSSSSLALASQPPQHDTIGQGVDGISKMEAYNGNQQPPTLHQHQHQHPHLHPPPLQPHLHQQQQMEEIHQTQNMDPMNALGNGSSVGTTTAAAGTAAGTGGDPNGGVTMTGGGFPGVGHQFIEITDFLNMPQKKAATRLKIPASTLSKRWKEAARNRKWPWRTVCKIDKEIGTLLSTIPSGSPIGPDTEACLMPLLRKRQDELKAVVIRL